MKVEGSDNRERLLIGSINDYFYIFGRIKLDNC